MRVLVIEDDLLIGQGIAVGLRQQGCVVDWLADGLDGRHVLGLEAYDALVLDLGLPGMDGTDLLDWARSHRHDIPVLVLTARDDVDSKVDCLNRGADDYMVKPFDLNELVARLRALTRRSRGRASSLIEWENLQLNPVSHEVRRQGKVLELSGREFALLEILLENAGKVVQRNRLMERLYSWDQNVESNVLEVHVHHLRKKLGSKLIHTVRGVGYTLRKQQP
jgi:two-component system response regulator QseB